MNEAEIKKYLKDNLRVVADIEEGCWNTPDAKRLVITLMLGREVINETKLWI